MKIAVIGGAGVRTVIFINGLLARYKALHIDEVALYDINQEKQQIITKLCRHVENQYLKLPYAGLFKGGLSAFPNLCTRNVCNRISTFSISGFPMMT